MRIVRPVHFRPLIILAASLALASCSPYSAPSVPTSVPPSSAPTQAPAASPTLAGQPVTSADQIVRVWQNFNPHCKIGFILIRPDGTDTTACSQDGTNQAISGKYSLQGSRITLNNDLCQGGQYDVRILQGGSQPKSLLFTVVKDDCSEEVQIMTQQPFLWVGALP